jgi:formamidopyrimidine-DNA glycosylase
MPELPEVETIRRQLIPLYQGEIIRKVNLKTPSLLKNGTVKNFQRDLAGKLLVDFLRRGKFLRGKFLIFRCEDVFPVFHLGMSGIFLQNKAESRYPQHIHLEMRFESGKGLYFQDVRKFGNIRLYKEKPHFPELGIEPFSEELTPEKMAEMLRSKKMNIKQFLMNQANIAGIGNIYASEILFEAFISPLRRTNELNEEESAALHRATGSVLTASIEKFGTTYSAYRTVAGTAGENQHFLKVYQRAGEGCYRCGSIIQKMVLGSRSTFYCGGCQK